MRKRGEGRVPEAAAKPAQQTPSRPLRAEGPRAPQGSQGRGWGAGQLLLSSHLAVGQDVELGIHAICYLHVSIKRCATVLTLLKQVGMEAWCKGSLFHTQALRLSMLYFRFV